LRHRVGLYKEQKNTTLVSVLKISTSRVDANR